MASDDIHRLKLQQLVASIRAWTGFVADVARVEVSEEGSAWRVALQPIAATACPIELVLDAGNSRCDLKIADEIYEDWPLPSLDVVLPLIQAVAEGRVVTRRTSSAATGLALSVSTLIKLANGEVLKPCHGFAPADGESSGAIEARDTHYVPYRKAGS